MDKNNPELKNVLEQYNKAKNSTQSTTKQQIDSIKKQNDVLSMTTDPDLLIAHEIVELPSNGLHYPNGLSEVAVEYMTAEDEDVLTTPSLIDNGTVLDVLLKRKVKTPNVNPGDLLPGDRNAILIFLRTSSYGNEYTVQVNDPRTGKPFEAVIDLLKLKYKEITEKPDENGFYSVYIPMRKKTVKFRLLTYNEDNLIYKRAEARQAEFNEEVSKYNTFKLIASIVSIDDNTNRDYIEKFIHAIPALDALTIRRKIIEVSPDIDLQYSFVTNDGYEFKANLVLGVDFFFPGS